jgi:hypothetical protein
MEAANRGARSWRKIHPAFHRAPHEQFANAYISPELSFNFTTFMRNFVRKSQKPSLCFGARHHGRTREMMTSRKRQN